MLHVQKETGDPMMLETFACSEALALADDLDIQNMVVASDCLEVVKDINKGTGGPNAAIIQEIAARISSYMYVLVFYSWV